MGSISVCCDCGNVYTVGQDNLLTCPKCGRVPILRWDGKTWTHKLEGFDLPKSIMGRKQEFEHKRGIDKYFKVKALLE
ncbi:MAG: hypothetical protein ACPLVJ_02770 [Candidatus Bathyarchaeales archaeon]